VDLEQDVPMGVGVMEIIPDEGSGKTSSPGARTGMAYGFITSGTQILVDPMTRERINAKAVTDQFGKPRYDGMGKPILEVYDSWFSLDFKLEWTDAPTDTDSGASTTGTTSVRY